MDKAAAMDVSKCRGNTAENTGRLLGRQWYEPIKCLT
jgi:hypothetical protein